ncbi:hypothetical protein BDB01DRAFT_884338 [Pilobolus umbonatus]|nr:hypothetical protein BDB01DRAFT_884338 [Pilobolus umbonatus]
MVSRSIVTPSDISVTIDPWSIDRDENRTICCTGRFTYHGSVSCFEKYIELNKSSATVAGVNEFSATMIGYAASTYSGIIQELVITILFDLAWKNGISRETGQDDYESISASSCRHDYSQSLPEMMTSDDRQTLLTQQIVPEMATPVYYTLQGSSISGTPNEMAEMKFQCSLILRINQYACLSFLNYELST